VVGNAAPNRIPALQQHSTQAAAHRHGLPPPLANCYEITKPWCRGFHTSGCAPRMWTRSGTSKERRISFFFLTAFRRGPLPSLPAPTRARLVVVLSPGGGRTLRQTRSEVVWVDFGASVVLSGPRDCGAILLLVE